MPSPALEIGMPLAAVKSGDGLPGSWLCKRGRGKECRMMAYTAALAEEHSQKDKGNTAPTQHL